MTKSSEALETVLRNMYGQEIGVMEQSKYTDITISSQLKEGYVGDSNGEIVGLSGLADGKILLVPFKKNYTYRHNISQERSNIYVGGKVYSLKFHPHNQNIFAIAIEDLANKPSGIAVVVGKYDSSKKDDITQLNTTVEHLATLKPVHAKRGIEIFWNHVVSDLLYSIGNEEINLLAFTKNASGQDSLQKICTYVTKEPCFVADACLSYDGRYLFATFNGKSTGERGNFLKVFRADYEAACAGRVECLTSANVGMGQTSKICALASGHIVLSRFATGKRQIVLFEFDEKQMSLKELDYITSEGSSILKMHPSAASDLFYTFGKGDSSMHTFCISSTKKIHHLGSFTNKSSMTGVVYMPEHYRSISTFEFQKMIVFCQENNSYSVGKSSSFILPRRGDPEELNCYDDMTYFEPSGTLQDWVAAKASPIPLKKIDPIQGDEKLQNYFGVSDPNVSSEAANDFFSLQGMASGTKPVSKPSITVAPAKAAPEVALSHQNDIKIENSVASESVRNDKSDSSTETKSKESSAEKKTQNIQIPQRTNHLTKKVEELEKLCNSLQKRIEDLEERNKAEKTLLDQLDI